MPKMQIMRLFTATAGLIMMAGTARAAIVHVVGGNLGWTVPQNKTYYDDWAKERVFGIGDKLLFSYKPPSDNVMMMKKKDYEQCTQNDPIDSWYTGQTVLALDKPGDYYFQGGVGLHCELGNRMHVHVIDGPGKPGVGDFNFHFHPFRHLVEVATPDPAPAASASFRVVGLDPTLLSFLVLTALLLMY